MVVKSSSITNNMLDRSFVDKVDPDREKLMTCYQCGTCSASCPTAFAMDYTPRQILRMIQLGLDEEVLTAKTPWLCASCYQCTVRCPHGISITQTMAAIKRMAVARGVRISTASPEFYRAFYSTVRNHGRSHEIELMMKFGSHVPGDMFGFAPLGMALMRKGKIAFTAHEVRGKSQIEAIFRKVDELEGRR